MESYYVCLLGLIFHLAECPQGPSMLSHVTGLPSYFVRGCSVVSDTPWTVACQAALSIGFPRLKYWSELPFPSPGDLLHPGIESESPALVGRFFTTEPHGKPTFLFKVEEYSIVYINHILFIHLSLDGHLGCFHLLAIVDSGAMNMGVQVYLWDSTLIDF